MSTESLRSTRRVSSLFLDRFHARLRNTNAFICGCSRLPTGLSRSAKRIHSGLNEGFNARLCGVYSQHPALSYAQGADSLDLPPDATIKLGDSLDLPPGATIKLGGQFRFYLRDATPKHGGGGWKFTSLSYCSFSAQPHITDSHISWTPKLSVGGSLISKSVLTKRVLMTLPCLW